MKTFTVESAGAKPIEGKKKQIKLFVAIPTTYLVDVRWAFRLHELLHNMPPNTVVASDWLYGVAESREKLAETFLSIDDTTHLLFIDSDVLPPADAASRLLQWDRPFVCGIYRNSLNSGINAWVNGQTIALDQPAPLVSVQQVGLGLALIQRRVFESIKTRPWFYFKSDRKAPMAEDFYFCRLAVEQGFIPHVDMTLKATHIKPTAFDPAGHET